MAKTTSTEFVEWLEFFELDKDILKKEDYYFAQMASEIRRSFVKNPRMVKMDDFLLEFKKAKESVADMASSKSAWGAILGINLGE